jgi:DNA-binding NtrC family response regulator
MSIFDDTLHGRSPELKTVTSTARLVAATDVTVLILGESGTGKELLARAVHGESRRAGGPFVSVNCASLTQDLAESALWGHRRGAFTGAIADHPGYVQTAHNGTLFLDEIGELTPGVQAKLLRFLECGECQPVGAATPRQVDVRVIAATNRDLSGDVARGAFREDLYYRLNVVPLELPTLAQRREDIDLLVERITADLARRYGLPAPQYSAAALERLRRYRWPGNVRELRNLCERMVILLGGRTVQAENLPREITGEIDAAQAGGFRLPEAGIRLDELEVQMIYQALERTGGNRSRAARLLGLTRDTLLYRMKKYAIQA